MNHVKLKQKFLSMISSSQDKVILQKMFDSGMEIRYDTAKGGYRLKRAKMNIADWKKFTKNQDKTFTCRINAAIKRLPFPLKDDNKSLNGEEKILPVKIAPYEEFLNDCHNYVFSICSVAYLLRVGLHYLIDKLQIGYDIKTKEITLPLDGVKGKRYFSIRLKADRAVDEEEAAAVLKYYNLKPYETAKGIFGTNEQGNQIIIGSNTDNPYSDIGKKILRNVKIC